MPDAIARFLDADCDRQVAFLAELVRCPTDNPPGDCAAHAALAARLLEDLGFAVEAHPVPEDAVRAAGMRSATNLIVRRRFGEGPTVALNAHGDVVPPGLGWTRDPYGAEIETTATGRRMYGRGAAVSKSDFATYAWALLALDQAALDGLALAGTVELHFTYDEEIGGTLGPQWLLEQGLSAPDMAICAGFSHAVVTAHNGCLHLEVTVTGRIGHAAEPERAADALEAATGVLAALYASRAGLADIRSAVPGIVSPTLVVGTIEGGINTNVVPDRVRFRIDRRILPEESIEAVEAGLVALIGETAGAFPGIAVTADRLLAARPLSPQPGWERIAAALRRHAEALTGEALPFVGAKLFTDARLYAERGIPAVLYGAGPRTLAEAGGHDSDETLNLADLRLATEVVARAIADLLAPR
ncbi:MAG: M20/M25/M40 family metallo-hydrolase [Rhodospirillaceae bacterium]